jgi:signal transduction histidine kinase
LCIDGADTIPRRHGRPPLSTEALFSSANFTLSLLPIRLAHRIQALRNLPFIVVSNPNISKIYNNYLHSLSTLLPYNAKTISTLEDEIRFTAVLADLVETHSHTIPTLARGFLECRRYIDPVEVTRFLDEHLRARIGTRLIAEQHIALHISSQPHQDPKSNPHPVDVDTSSSYIGVIDTALQPAAIINSCGNFVSEICELKYGVRPTWIIDGEPATTFAFVPVHLEYIITELLKNAFRATVESGRSHEPIVITIAAEPESTADLDKVGGKALPRADDTDNPPIKPFEESAPGVTIRIRDRGGGISPEVLPNIWSYSFTTFSEDELPGQTPGSGSMDALNAISGAGGEGSSIAGLGYGLPLGRAYAEYFGGGIAVQSLYGWGCDVYLRLKGLGRPKG